MGKIRIFEKLFVFNPHKEHLFTTPYTHKTSPFYTRFTYFLMFNTVFLRALPGIFAARRNFTVIFYSAV